jgi:hypothetical protein
MYRQWWNDSDRKAGILVEKPGPQKRDAATNHVSHDTAKCSALSFTIYWAFKLKSLIVPGYNEIGVNGKVQV